MGRKEGRNEQQFNRRSSNKSSLDFPPLIEKRNDRAAAVGVGLIANGLEKVGELHIPFTIELEINAQFIPWKCALKLCEFDKMYPIYNAPVAVHKTASPCT